MAMGSGNSEHFESSAPTVRETDLTKIEGGPTPRADVLITREQLEVTVKLLKFASVQIGIELNRKRRIGLVVTVVTLISGVVTALAAINSSQQLLFGVGSLLAGSLGVMVGLFLSNHEGREEQVKLSDLEGKLRQLPEDPKPSNGTALEGRETGGRNV